ncbi:MAG: hypothetical protein KGH87_01025 [Thaumarchaeota archaeon]|nr:hypothetical protein [Nitrososphaerota archaeon]
MKLSKKNILIFSAIGAAIISGLIIFPLFANSVNKEPEIVIGREVDDLNPVDITIQEPSVTVASTADNLNPDTKLLVPANLLSERAYLILIENYSIADTYGNVDRIHPPPIPVVKKGVPTPVDVVISPTLSGESGNFYVALEFTYCAPLYRHNDPAGPCIEKNLAVSLPQHVVSLNQHFNMTVTAPDNIPSGLYQLGILARTNLYSGTNPHVNGSSADEPFWISVVR